ncbi:MAG: AraC family transcriptional regulator [Pseudomonadota bacterium]
MVTIMASSDSEKPPEEHVKFTIDNMRDAADAHRRGLSQLYLPGKGYRVVEPDSEHGDVPLPQGTHKINSLSDDLLLARSDMHDIPENVAQQRWDLDMRGWLFLHFRLEGLSRETLPDGTERTVGGNSFLLSASQSGPYGTRQVIGDSWRTVGIACRPSFIADELKISSDNLPRELRQFQEGDETSEFWFAGELTAVMMGVANALLKPLVHETVRPIYLRAKAVELVCLAVDRLRQPEQLVDSGIKLSNYDVSCMHRAQQILDDSRRAPTLEELARLVGVNRNKLAVGFKHVFGMTVGTYHRERRLTLAFDLLKESGVSIALAADEAGYRDASSFSKAFKVRFGVLPSDVRS